MFYLLISGSDTKLAFHIYNETTLFSSVNSRFKINSKVAAGRLTKDGQDVTDLGGPLLTAVFKSFEVGLKQKYKNLPLKVYPTQQPEPSCLTESMVLETCNIRI